MTTATMELSAEVAGTDSQSPYKGLDYYEERDEDYFAGREADIAQLVARVTTMRAFVLYGRSGLGKTSLLLAGVFPELRRQDYQPVYVRTVENPLADLIAAIRGHCPSLADTTGTLKELVAKAAEDSETGRLLLVVDQFEEFFIRFRAQPKLRAEFVTALSSVITDKESDVRVTFSLREDYLAALDDFQRTLPDLLANAYRLLPLTALSAREAIVRPLKRSGIAFDELLVSRLVDELAAFDFDSARLQITCTELYQSARRKQTSGTRLREEDFDKLSEETGGLEGVFRRYLQTAIDDIPSEQHVLARTMLDALITREETKFAISRAELLSLDYAPDQEVEAVLAILINHRIVRPPGERRGAEPRYELIHECLVPEIKRWLEENEEFANFRFVREVIANNSREGRFRRHGPWLDADILARMVNPHKPRLRPTPAQLEYIVWSAIRAQIEDIGDWLEQFGHKESADLVFSLLDSEDVYLRAGAAAAALYCVTGGHPVVKKCLTLALDGEQSEAVQRAAGRVVAALATDEEISCIKRHFSFRRRVEPHLKELLANLQEKQRVRRLFGVFGFWRARRAQRALERRLLKAQSEQVKAVGRSGAISGALAGLVWTVTSGLVAFLLLDWICNPFPTKSFPAKFTSYLGATLPISAALGGLVGWRIATSLRRRGVILENPSWAQVVRRSKLLFWLLLLPALFMGGAIMDVTFVGLGIPDLASGYTLYFCLLVVGFVLAKTLRFLLAEAAQLSSSAASAFSLFGSILWSILPNIVLAILLPSVALTLTSSLLGKVLVSKDRIDRLPDLLWSAVIVAIVSGLFLFIATATLGVRASAQRRWARLYFGLAALLILPWFLISYGMNSFPLLAQQPRNLEIRAELSRWPETDYFSIAGTLLRTKLPSDARVAIDRRDLGTGKIDGEVVLLLPTGKALLAISNFNSEAKPLSATMTFSRLELHSGVLDLARSAEMIYARCDVQPPSKGGAPSKNARRAEYAPADAATNGSWSGALEGSFTGAKGSDRVELTFYRNSVLNGAVAFQLEKVLAGESEQTPPNLKLAPLGFRLDGDAIGVFDANPVTNASDRERLTDVSLAQRVPLNNGRWKARIEVSPLGPLSQKEPYPSIVVGVRLVNLPVEQLIKLANDFVQTGDIDSAIDTYRQIVDLLPGNVEALNDLVQALSQQGRFDEALPDAEKAVKLAPENVEALNGLAWALCRKGRFDEALPDAEKAVKLAPETADVLDTLAHAAYGAGQWGEADRSWSKVLELDPKFFERYKSSCGEDLAHLKEAKQKAASEQAAKEPQTPPKKN